MRYANRLRQVETHIGLCEADGMDNDQQTGQGERLKQARIAKGFRRAKDAATYYGWSYTSYAQHEDGKRGLSRAASRYAKAFGVSEAWLLTGEPRAAPPEVKGTLTPVGNDGDYAPVIGKVQAGVWADVEYLEDVPVAVLPVVRDSRFPSRPHVVYEVVGDSYDKYVREGGYVVAIPWADVGYLDPAVGMTVVAEQLRDGDGSLVQRTLKRVEGRPGNWRLMPQSTNPAHKPIPLTGDPNDHRSVRIAALVVQFINPAEW